MVLRGHVGVAALGDQREGLVEQAVEGHAQLCRVAHREGVLAVELLEDQHPPALQLLPVGVQQLVEDAGHVDRELLPGGELAQLGEPGGHLLEPAHVLLDGVREPGAELLVLEALR